jgi:hypothetical protein
VVLPVPDHAPAGYTKFRRVGALCTNTSSQWIAFVQVGDEFQWVATAVNATNVALSSTAIAFALSVPLGIIVMARFNALITNTGNAYITFYALSRGVQVGNSTNASLAAAGTTAQAAGAFVMETNTLGQIGLVSQPASAGAYYIGTYGWIDRRGRDA